MREIDEILLQSSTGTEALRRLLEWKRQTDEKWSHLWIAKKLGLSSKGYVADILSKRRNFSVKLWAPTVELLALTGMSAKYLKLLLHLEGRLLKGEDFEEDSYKKLESMRKVLNGRHRKHSEKFVSDQTVLQVHTAFGLFQNQPTRAQLIQFFGRDRIVEVDRALHTLVTENIVEKSGETYRMDKSNQNLSMFGETSQRDLVIKLIRQGLDESKAAIETWGDLTKFSRFRSAYLSVKREAYVNFLESFSDEILRMHSEITSGEGDMIVRLDYQIYPIGAKDKTGLPFD